MAWTGWNAGTSRVGNEPEAVVLSIVVFSETVNDIDRV